MEHLDTKTNSRVTMKMDVSYTDHSHIIGKGGNTIRRVMAETNCHIHFPDSNRSNPNEKSNQVSIAGEMEGVERARSRVRELTPLLFHFDLPIVPSFQSPPDPNSPYLRAIQDQYNIQIMFRQKQKNFHTTTVVVKGCEWEGSRVKEATLLLMDHLCHQMAATVPVVMTMEISPQHHSVVLGKGNINLKIIMQRTNTTIIFPDAGDPNIPTIKKGSVSISGAIHNVYLARQQLLGSLPLVMMFDLPDNIDIQDAAVQKLQEDHEVTISVKPKARQSNKSVIIKAQERNANGMYLARADLLTLEDGSVRAEIPETYKVPLINNSANYCVTLPTNRSTYLNINTGLANTYGASPASPGYIASPYTPGAITPVNIGPAFTPSLARPNSPWFNAAPPTHSPAHQTSVVQPPNPPNTPVGGVGLGGLPPNHPYLQDYAMLVLNNITRLQQQQQEAEREQQRAKQAGTWPSPNSSGHVGFSSSGMGSSLHSSPVDSPRNSSPVNAAGNLNLHKMDITNNSTIPGNGSSGIATDKNSTIGSDISAILSELSVGDRRAPGCEKKVVQIACSVAQGQQGPLTSNLSPDYDHKKLMAAKALQHKPAGEPRTPNPVWSGLGFSSSMPEAVMREKLQSEQTAARQAVAQDRPPAPGNGDWFAQSTVGNGFDALLPPKEGAGHDDLPAILAKSGLSKYTDIFLRHEIDLPTFATLTDDELKEIGIHTFGARKKLLLLASKIASKSWP